MKRFSIILLTLLYTSLSLGVDLNLHYCGGKLANINLIAPASSCCCDAKAGNSDCCDDTQLSMQMEVDQVLTGITEFSIPSLKVHAVNPLALYENAMDTEETVIHIQAKPPPKSSERRIELGSLTLFG